MWNDCFVKAYRGKYSLKVMLHWYSCHDMILVLGEPAESSCGYRAQIMIISLSHDCILIEIFAKLSMHISHKGPLICDIFRKSYSWNFGKKYHERFWAVSFVTERNITWLIRTHSSSIWRCKNEAGDAIRVIHGGSSGPRLAANTLPSSSLPTDAPLMSVKCSI